MHATAIAPAPADPQQRVNQLRAAEMSCLLLSMQLCKIPADDLDSLARILYEFATRDMGVEKITLFDETAKRIYFSTGNNDRSVALGALEKMFNDVDQFVIGYREGVLSEKQDRDCLRGCFGVAQLVSDELTRIAAHLGLWLSWAGEPAPANHWANLGLLMSSVIDNLTRV